MKFFTICLFFLSIFINTSAQKFHINLFGGISNYKGDLQQKRLSFSQARPAYGAGFSYDVMDKLNIRIGFTLAEVTADDKVNPEVAFRNLNFTSSITEGHVAAIYYLLDPNENFISPYLFAGLAVYHYDPYTFDSTATKVFLRPLSTEGEGFVPGRKEYNLTQFAIPFGGGVKFAVTRNIDVGFEIGLRKLFTDYLDDVSTRYVDKALLLANRGQLAVSLAYRGGELKNGDPYPGDESVRGDPRHKDLYYFTLLTASIRFGKEDSNGNSVTGISNGFDRNKRNRSRNRMGCPHGIY